jgi:hypothetical protein
VTFHADGHIFHVRKAADNDRYLLFIIKGDEDREIARIKSSDANFASSVLVAIGDAVPFTE